MKRSILRLLILALACASAVMLITRARAQKSPVNQEFAVSLLSLGIAMPAQTPAAPATPREKTVEQTHKNIQVLKGLPDSQLGTVMQYIAVSMGRRCDFCHVNKGGNNWVWESDDKEEKLTARKMMTMVLALNKDNFGGSPTMGCYTCHRGRSTPQGIPSFPLPTPAPRPQPQTAASGQPGATPTPTPAPPTADQILAKYVEALGGQAAIDKMKTLVMKGTYVGFNGASLPYEVDLAAPDKFYINVNAQQGTVERGFDGKAGWEKGPRGVNELMNPVLDDLKSTFLFFHNIKLKEQFTLVNGTNADNRREQLFFDAETGLLRRRISYIETPIGVIPNQIDFEDYRVVDGVKVPFTVKVSSVEPGLVSTRTYTEIKLNALVDDSKFRMPAVPAKP